LSANQADLTSCKYLRQNQFLLCKALHNKKNWLFVGSERAGQHAAAIQTLLGTAKLNGLNPAA
jgi:hypothetical protein